MSYGANEMTLLLTSSRVLQTYYQEHGEWKIDDTSAYKVNIAGGDNVHFQFKLSRRSKFVVFNVIMPIVFLAAINVLVFVLPAESGERIGFSVTVLLALAVFLTLVGDNLPKTSEPMPIFSKYLVAILLLSLSMCIFAIFNLRIYHKDENAVPPKICQCFAGILLCRICRNRKVRAGGNTANEKNLRDSDSEKDKGIKQFTSWKDVSYAVDIVCLVLFLVAVVVVNVYYILVLMYGGKEDD